MDRLSLFCLSKKLNDPCFTYYSNLTLQEPWTTVLLMHYINSSNRLFRGPRHVFLQIVEKVRSLWALDITTKSLITQNNFFRVHSTSIQTGDSSGLRINCNIFLPSRVFMGQKVRKCFHTIQKYLILIFRIRSWYTDTRAKWFSKSLAGPVYTVHTTELDT